MKMTTIPSLTLVLVTVISFTFTLSEPQGLSFLSSGELKEESDVFITSWFGRAMTCRFDHCAIICEGDQAMLNYCPFFPKIKNLAAMTCTLASDQCTLSCDGRAVGNICQAITGATDLVRLAQAKTSNLRTRGRQLGNVYRPSIENQQASQWPLGRVCYVMAPDVNRDRIRSAMENWTAYTGMTFQDCQDERDCCASCGQYVNFQKGEGCWSYVGRQPESTCGFGGQTLSVASECSEGNIMHEIGHAVGLLHEHTRRDRDEHVKVKMENIKPIYRPNFEITKSSTGGETLIPLNGAYDYASIMHYSSKAFAVNPTESTIVPVDREGNVRNDVDIGQRRVLSPQDVDTIVALYRLDRPVRPAAPEAEGAGSEARVLLSTDEWLTLGLVILALVVILMLLNCCGRKTKRTSQPRKRVVKKMMGEYQAYPDTPGVSGHALTTRAPVKPEPKDDGGLLI